MRGFTFLMAEKNDIHVYRHLISAFFVGGLLASAVTYPLALLLLRAFGPGYFATIVKGGKVSGYLELGFWVVVIVVWFRPLALYLSKKRGDLREAAVARFNSTYYFFIFLSAAMLAASLLEGLFFNIGLPPAWKLKDFLFCLLVPEVYLQYYFVYFAVIFLEPVMFEKVAHRLYDEEGLYKKKRGLNFGVRARLFLMILNLAVIPMLILAVSIAVMDVPGYKNEKYGLLMLIGVSLACILGYSEMIYRSVTKPLAELVKKMGRLAEGDFSVKTTVLSEDEIGTVKAHFNDMVAAMDERERLKDTFGRYVSIEIARQLMSSGKIKLGGDSISATILFSDIRDFTPLSEGMSAGRLVEFLNSYFSHIVAPITEHHGVVNKFIGDAVMAIFAPQFGSENHVEDAMRAALGMRESLKEFNRKGLAPREVRFGVGLHTGVLVAGNIGTEQRLEFTVIGDTVNIASRIESANKALDSTILISDAVYSGIGENLRASASFERCEDVTLKGKTKAMTLYRVV